MTHICADCGDSFARPGNLVQHRQRCAELGDPVIPPMPSFDAPAYCPRCSRKWLRSHDELVCLMCGPWTPRREPEPWAMEECEVIGQGYTNAYGVTVVRRKSTRPFDHECCGRKFTSQGYTLHLVSGIHRRAQG